MLYGCCVNLLPKTLDRIGLEYAGRLKRLGYDYIELPLNELAQLSEQEFRDARTVLEELDLPCRACNDFMPARFQITGPDVTSRAELTDYLRRALERAARLGISFAVFGSPWSRSCPEHYSREAAFGQIAEFLSLAGEEAAPYQVVIAIEPINRGETNMLNHFSDGVRMARTVDYPNVRVLCDYYHLRFEGDSPSVLLDGGRVRRGPSADRICRRGERRVQGGCPGALGGAGSAGPGKSQAGAGLTVPPPSFNIFLS